MLLANSDAGRFQETLDWQKLVSFPSSILSNVRAIGLYPRAVCPKQAALVTVYIKKEITMTFSKTHKLTGAASFLPKNHGVWDGLCSTGDSPSLRQEVGGCSISP